MASSVECKRFNEVEVVWQVSEVGRFDAGLTGEYQHRIGSGVWEHRAHRFAYTYRPTKDLEFSAVLVYERRDHQLGCVAFLGQACIPDHVNEHIVFSDTAVLQNAPPTTLTNNN